MKTSALKNLSKESSPPGEVSAGTPSDGLRAGPSEGGTPGRLSHAGSNAVHRARRGAFSLIELLIVMAIILILYVMYFSAGSKSFQSKQKAACQRNLQIIYVALKTYAADEQEMFPVVPGAQTSEAALSVLVPRYTTTTENFSCPGTKEKPPPAAEPFANAKISYAYYMGAREAHGADQALLSDEQVNNKPKAAQGRLFSPDGKPPGDNHNKYGGNVMFCDGSVKSSGPAAKFALTLRTNVVLLNPKP